MESLDLVGMLTLLLQVVGHLNMFDPVRDLTRVTTIIVLCYHKILLQAVNKRIPKETNRNLYTRFIIQLEIPINSLS